MVASRYQDKPQGAIEMEVLETEDVENLYALQVYLGNKMTDAHVALSKTTVEEERIPLRAALAWADNMLDVCKKRQETLKEDNNAFNKRFRQQAQRLLTRPKYDEIAIAATR